jgi:hypothetical protein
VSNKLEAALGPIHRFKDSDGDAYEATQAELGGKATIILDSNGEFIEFYKADATKIIALIAEAAK